MSIYKGTDLVAGSIMPSYGDIIDTLYPVGSVYIGTTSTCPLATVKGTWELVSSGRVLQGADSNHVVGTTIEAGLPNITGSSYASINQSGLGWSSNGALYGSRNSEGYVCSSFSTAYNLNDTINFDASLSSSIYGNSSTVQPPAYCVNIWKRTA